MQTNKIIIQLLFATLILMTVTACPMEQKLTQNIVFELGGEVGVDSSGVVISDLSKIDETKKDSLKSCLFHTIIIKIN